ncbi:response regulator transcription factor [Lysinibacillus sp. FSL M8-0216]|uniref:DNA-binding response regulator, OmpR family, contains REC and winged-helix (WHTH) domain n=3 Tax=Lysinibacillus fusiformis TaxID=28031 RepID=A0A1H9MNJ8_9BACI|nr:MULTISPECIES: response regulator transcription factor [Lysinibacillus]EAZ85552.1 two-component response regulator [Bacillus sp. B14905]MCG7434992.1 response regulator transcription factor [Lysinibacillus fusiformis]MED4669507.1 response regulator transcription factor [Lysinibacillus fusiformis]NOG26357.1 response regulator transcription factor [Lysinibacillus fusiformis]PCD84895.1 DNA-binding response regulator [Lysinibacillus fusiformis]
MNILIADDEVDMLKILQNYFQREGFTVFTATNGEEALTVFYQERIDLAILDWMMPKVDGMMVCREMKRTQKIKVLMLTARDTGEDEFKALADGADDYVNKPFYPKVLIMRAKKLLQIEAIQQLHDVSFDVTSKRVWRAGTEIELTKTEFELLRIFSQNRRQILTRDQLLDLVWGLDYMGDPRTVDTHIRRLREKIGENIIQTHRGIGYSTSE